jgi:hypothetical protein
MAFWIAVFLIVTGFAFGYGVRDVQECMAQRKACKRVEQDLHTVGAAYDACEGPTTDYDTEAVRKLLNSW